MFFTFFALSYNNEINVQGHWAQGSIIYLNIGPVAQAEDYKSFKEEKSLIEETMLVNEEVDFSYSGLRGWSEDECLLS